MAHDVFISHSSNNRTIANAVCAALEAAAIRCWIAPRDVMPGRSYSGEITRAIQQSRAFILIFSEHSNNSEQVLREVQLAANSRLHIIQFRIDAVSPSDDLEYYLSGPHWLDAVTPPLENHLAQLTSSMKALLALPPTGQMEQAPEPPPPLVSASQPSPLPPSPVMRSAALPATSKMWKWVALGVGMSVALGCVAFAVVFALLRPQPTASTEPRAAPRLSAVPPSGSTLLPTDEAERFVKALNRDMEQGNLPATTAYFDDTVDYYVFGPKPKAFIAEQLRQYFAAIPVRVFNVSNVKVQAGPQPTVATVFFDTHYSVRDFAGTPASGRTHTEWDVVRRSDGLKITRTNWMTYPDATPSQ
jgi:TIR domain-containing protein